MDTIATTLSLPSMLSLNDIAQHLGCHVDTARRYFRQRVDGFPKPTRIGGLVRFRRDDFLNWLERRTGEQEHETPPPS